MGKNCFIYMTEKQYLKIAKLSKKDTQIVKK